MQLNGPPAAWLPEWLYRYQERLAIMLDSRVSNAEQKAEEDVRRVAEREGGEQLRLGMSTPGAIGSFRGDKGGRVS